MKQYKNELDVDAIGGHETLTREEELAISEYIKNEKLKVKRQESKRRPLIAGGNKALI